MSPAFLYRYLPNKRSVVVALYDQLSETFAQQASEMLRGKWRERFVFTLELSLRALGPHRVRLRALAPVMVGDADEGVFAQHTAFSRKGVESIFQEVVVGAIDAPKRPLAESLDHFLYLAHLAVILWWLLDRSLGQPTCDEGIGRTHPADVAVSRADPSIYGLLEDLCNQRTRCSGKGCCGKSWRHSEGAGTRVPLPLLAPGVRVSRT